MSFTRHQSQCQNLEESAVGKKGHGENCTYCKRILEGHSSRSKVAATRDHVHPKSLGGRVTVWSCRQCNSIKGAMTESEWFAFMAATPEWWMHPKYRHHGPSFKRTATKSQKAADVATEILSRPSDVPVEYDDPLAQAAFVAVYRNRLHMLRIKSVR